MNGRNIINKRKLNYKYIMKLSMIEIYNEKIKDLLSKINYLKICGNDKTGIYINNLLKIVQLELQI